MSKKIKTGTDESASKVRKLQKSHVKSQGVTHVESSKKAKSRAPGYKTSPGAE